MSTRLITHALCLAVFVFCYIFICTDLDITKTTSKFFNLIPWRCQSLPVLATPTTSVKTDEWDLSWGVTFVLILEPTEYSECSGLMLSALGFDGDCASYPSGLAGAMLITLDNNLMLDINHVLLIATEWVISSRRPRQETYTNLAWSSRPRPLISSTKYLTPSHHTSVTNGNLSLPLHCLPSSQLDFPAHPIIGELITHQYDNNAILSLNAAKCVILVSYTREASFIKIRMLMSH
jgi:hypothetical protein